MRTIAINESLLKIGDCACEVVSLPKQAALEAEIAEIGDVFGRYTGWFIRG